MFIIENKRNRPRPGFKGFVNQPSQNFSGFINQPPSTFGSWYNPYGIFDDMKKVYTDTFPPQKFTSIPKTATTNAFPAVDYGEQYGPGIATDKVPTNAFELQLQQQMQKAETGSTPDIVKKFATQENISRIVLGSIAIGAIVLIAMNMRKRA